MQACDSPSKIDVIPWYCQLNQRSFVVRRQAQSPGKQSLPQYADHCRSVGCCWAALFFPLHRNNFILKGLAGRAGYLSLLRFPSWPMESHFPFWHTKALRDYGTFQIRCVFCLLTEFMFTAYSLIPFSHSLKSGWKFMQHSRYVSGFPSRMELALKLLNVPAFR